MFESRKLEAAEIFCVQKKEIIEFCSKFFSKTAPTCRKLSIHVWGSNVQTTKRSGEPIDTKKDPDLKELTIIDNLTAFKAGKEFYPASH